MTTTATDNPAVGNFAMPSTQPQTVTTIFTSSGNGEEPTPDVLPSENIGNLTPSARTSRTRVDLLTTSPPGEITTTTRPARDEDGNGAPVQEPAREEARAEPTVSLSLLVLSGDRKTFTFSPDTTIRRVKEVIWTTWDADWTKAPVPPNPSYLRVLYSGRLLQDDDTLEKLKLPTHIPMPDHEEGRGNTYVTTVMHLSIRPVAPPEDDELSKKKGKRRHTSENIVGEGETQSGCCSGCVIC